MEYDYEKSPQGVTVGGENYNANYGWILEHIAGELDRRKSPVNVLEIGCGGGRNLKVIHSVFGDRVTLTGIDVSAAAIGFARELGVGDFHRMESDNILLDTKYDLILMIDMLEHLLSRPVVTRTLRQGSKYLQVDGRIYVSVPIERNKYCLTWMFNRCGHMRDLTKKYYGHSLQFDVEEIEAMMRDARLDREDVFFSVHWLGQVYVLMYYFIPKILLEWLYGEVVANEMRDSNMEMKKGRHRMLGWVKKVWLATGYPLSCIAYGESRIRRHSFVGAGNMHIVLRSSEGPR